MTQSWIICEESGRWAAALRVAFNRSADIAPRLIEVRSLLELSNRPTEQTDDLVLIEVGIANVAEVAGFAARLNSQVAPFVALLKDAAEGRRLADLLWEAGAVDVLSSPRELRGLLELHRRLATRSRVGRGPSLEQPSLTSWAWSMVPWQGA